MKWVSWYGLFLLVLTHVIKDIIHGKPRTLKHLTYKLLNSMTEWLHTTVNIYISWDNFVKTSGWVILAFIISWNILVVNMRKCAQDYKVLLIYMHIFVWECLCYFSSIYIYIFYCEYNLISPLRYSALLGYFIWIKYY